MELVKHDAIEASDDLTRSDIAAAAGSARIEQEIVDQLRCGEDDLAATALVKLRDMPCVVLRCPTLRQNFFRLPVSGGPAFTLCTHEPTSALQFILGLSYVDFCLKKNKTT